MSATARCFLALRAATTGTHLQAACIAIPHRPAQSRPQHCARPRPSLARSSRGDRTSRPCWAPGCDVACYPVPCFGCTSTSTRAPHAMPHRVTGPHVLLSALPCRPLSLSFGGPPRHLTPFTRCAGGVRGGVCGLAPDSREARATCSFPHSALPVQTFIARNNHTNLCLPSPLPSHGCPSVCLPPRDIPSGCCFCTGPWTVTRSSLRMLRRVAAFCRPLRPVLLLVSFPPSRSPVVGVPGLWRDVPFARQRRPVVGVLGVVLVVVGVVLLPTHLRPQAVHNLPLCVSVCVSPRCPAPHGPQRWPAGCGIPCPPPPPH